ncbi:protein-L-isoaspartate(D-aspartate) O-methyltransferase [bacterium]|nr:protein-L-isoaspartate(D-aspartate) O-methyltransferase [candidate division CSSED10-310 bacterium]
MKWFASPHEPVAARRDMVERQLKNRGIHDPRVLAAFLTVPRHEFVDPHHHARAYHDYPLHIGEEQTISQPYMVALMTECLRPRSTDKVLEIGTGSGYQAAILSVLCHEVVTVERLPRLAERARTNLARLGHTNVRVLIGDGTLGCPEEQPFDGIVVTAGAPAVPPALKEQLAPGGRLVIPVGDRFMQELVVVERTGSGFCEHQRGGCVFVKLIGIHGWNQDP